MSTHNQELQEAAQKEVKHLELESYINIKKGFLATKISKFTRR
jgi:hypothetical protein